MILWTDPSAECRTKVSRDVPYTTVYISKALLRISHMTRRSTEALHKPVDEAKTEDGDITATAYSAPEQ